MSMNEAETRAKLIDPALYRCGWTEDLIRREETAGAIERQAFGVRRGRKRLDYSLRILARANAQPVEVAIVEAKKAGDPPTKGLQQSIHYAELHHVPFAFSTNGYMFVEYDRTTGKTSDPRSLSEFPTPDELRRRFEVAVKFSLDSVMAAPLSQPYSGGEASRRYYQDAAIRATLEAIASGQRHILLALATGSGKTFLAAQLLRRIADAGQLRRALFVCDRDELRTNAKGALHSLFGDDAAPITRDGKWRNAKVLIATYQTLAFEDEDLDGATLLESLPTNYFSHIVVDECHRSAWGKWSKVLSRNPGAIVIGLTATPRQLKTKLLAAAEAQADLQADPQAAPQDAPPLSPEEIEDAAITADNLRYFGEPVYEYSFEQGCEDGYLAACDIIDRRAILGEHGIDERESGLNREDLHEKVIRDADTGEALPESAPRQWYGASSFEHRLVLPDRAKAMSADLFAQFLNPNYGGDPCQKSIVFCVSEAHADAVVAALNNCYADWCQANGVKPTSTYAFKCMAKEGADTIADLRGAASHHFIAVTVDLLTTGVDIPWLRNVVFFRYVRSSIALHQMMGRGSRIHEPSGKLSFRVFDYTGATELYGQPFFSAPPATESQDGVGPTMAPERRISVEGIEVVIVDGGHYVISQVDGNEVRISIEEYREQMAVKAIELCPDLEQFRKMWISPPKRAAFMSDLPDSGRSVEVLRRINGQTDYDEFDVIGEAAYGLEARTRTGRSDAFCYKQQSWLGTLPDVSRATLLALVAQFAQGGTSELENTHVFDTPAVTAAGGARALGQFGSGAQVLLATKERLFAA